MPPELDVVADRSTAVESLTPSTNKVESIIDLTVNETEEGDDKNVRPYSTPDHQKPSRERPGVPQTLMGEDSDLPFEDEGYHTGVKHKPALPPTPSPTPKMGHKRNISDLSDNDLIELTDKPCKRVLFEVKACVTTRKPSAVFTNIPSFSVLATPRRVELSPTEMRRVSEAIIDQVDWGEVADYVASNRGAEIYKMAFKGTMQAKVDELEDKTGGDNVVV